MRQMWFLVMWLNNKLYRFKIRIARNAIADLRYSFIAVIFAASVIQGKWMFSSVIVELGPHWIVNLCQAGQSANSKNLPTKELNEASWTRNSHGMRFAFSWINIKQSFARETTRPLLVNLQAGRSGELEKKSSVHWKTSIHWHYMQFKGGRPFVIVTYICSKKYNYD